MKTVESKERVNTETLQLYDNIDGLKVIEEALLFHGCEIVHNKHVNIKYLERVALVTYGLKSSGTNKLYVGLYLDRFFKRNGLSNGHGAKNIRVPDDVYDRVKALNDSYKTAANQAPE